MVTDIEVAYAEALIVARAAERLAVFMRISEAEAANSIVQAVVAFERMSEHIE